MVTCFSTQNLRISTQKSPEYSGLFNFHTQTRILILILVLETVLDADAQLARKLLIS